MAKSGIPGVSLRTASAVCAAIWLAGAGAALIGVFADSARYSSTRHSLYIAARTTVVILPVGALFGWLLGAWMWNRMFAGIAGAPTLEGADHDSRWSARDVLVSAMVSLGVAGVVLLFWYRVANDPASTTSWFTYAALSLAFLGSWQADLARRIHAVEVQLHVSYLWLGGRRLGMVPSRSRTPATGTRR